MRVVKSNTIISITGQIGSILAFQFLLCVCLSSGLPSLSLSHFLSFSLSSISLCLIQPPFILSSSFQHSYSLCLLL